MKCSISTKHNYPDLNTAIFSLIKKLKKIYFITLFFSISLFSFAQTFPCDTAARLYFFRDVGGANGSLSYISGYATGSPIITDLFNMPTLQHNGLAANTSDNYLYYFDNTVLTRLDALGNATPLWNMGMGFSTVYGCFDSWNRYWTITSTYDLLAIDINTGAIIKGPFNYSALLSPLVGTGGTLDIVFNPYDCYFYFSIFRCDTSGVVDGAFAGINFNPTGTYGGTAMGLDGKLYGISGGFAGAGNLSSIDFIGLTSASTFTFTPNPSPMRSDMASFLCYSVQADFAFVQVPCTSGPTILFTNQSTASVNNWLWNFGDPASSSNTSTLQNPTHTFSSAGTYTVSLIVTDPGSACFFDIADTTTTLLTVSNSSPSITASCIPVSCNGGNNGSVTVSTSGGTPSYTYAWNTGQTTYFATGLGAGNYTVTVTDAKNCTSTAGVTVAEAPCPCPIVNLAVPNAFSPNDDGENDEFCLQRGIDYCITELAITIYDRWGDRVYESADKNFCWDGTRGSASLTTDQGKGIIDKGRGEMNTAVFVYHMQAILSTGEKVTKKGNVSIIK